MTAWDVRVAEVGVEAVDGGVEGAGVRVGEGEQAALIACNVAGSHYSQGD